MLKRKGSKRNGNCQRFGKKSSYRGGKGNECRGESPDAGEDPEVLVKVGDQVKEDDEILMLEAMKMENPIYAPTDGTVKEIKVKANDSVETEQVMVIIG